MKKPAIREVTLSKIARSIEEAWTLEQLISTEQFFCLYYNQFTFENQYLHREWTMDNQIRAKKQSLTALEGAQSITFDPRRPSLRRLEKYVTTISLKEFEAQWPELQTQLAGIGMVEMSLYPSVCERAATLSHQLIKQAHTPSATHPNTSLLIAQRSVEEHINQVIEVCQSTDTEVQELVAQCDHHELEKIVHKQTNTDAITAEQYTSPLLSDKELMSSSLKHVAPPEILDGFASHVKKVAAINRNVIQSGENDTFNESPQEAISGIIYTQKNLSGTLLQASQMKYAYIITDAQAPQGNNLTIPQNAKGIAKAKELPVVLSTEELSHTGTVRLAYTYGSKDYTSLKKAKSVRIDTITPVRNPKKVASDNLIDVIKDRDHDQSTISNQLAKKTLRYALPHPIALVLSGQTTTKRLIDNKGHESSQEGINWPVDLNKRFHSNETRKSITQSFHHVVVLNKPGKSLPLVDHSSAHTQVQSKHTVYNSITSAANTIISFTPPQGTSNHLIGHNRGTFSVQKRLKNTELPLIAVNESNVPVWLDNPEVQYQPTNHSKQAYAYRFAKGLIGGKRQLPSF